MKKIKLSDASTLLDTLSEDERRALRGSRFAPLPSCSSVEVKVESRVAHPGGRVATNKAAALAKFLERKLDKASIPANLDPVLVEAAVENAKAGLSASSSKVRHVERFSESDEELESVAQKEVNSASLKKKKKKKKRKRSKAAPLLQSSGVGGSSHKGLLKKKKH